MIALANPTSTDRSQSRLLNLAALALALYSLALSLAPLVRARSLQADIAWQHWLGFFAWLGLFNLVHRTSTRRLPKRDPLLLPVAGLLMGWGLLTIYRLFPAFGLRQTGWMVFSMMVFVAGLRLSSNLRYLRHYKYLWLSGGLLLAALTLILGTNPLGYGPRMWLGCCGIYLQPSEPLKLLLVIYLAAYLADRFSLSAFGAPTKPGAARIQKPALLPLLLPTLVMTGMALLVLLIQRDLGTASIFLFLYSVMVYIASGRRRVLLVAGVSLAIGSLAAYWLFDVVKLRINAWINPWLDPAGQSYQIVQSLIAVANGGLTGRGPGLGDPGLVPIPHSDFIFTAIFEESGLAGAIVLIGLIALLAGRAVRSALNSADPFQRYLAAGLAAYLGGQSILIIGGNLRMLPLTGVTLPFVSYGGSSLLVSVLSLLLLCLINNSQATQPALRPDPRPLLHLGTLLLAGLACATLVSVWWAVVRGPDLLTRTDNPRRAISDQTVRRGAILDRNDQPINLSEGEPGQYTRVARYTALGPVAGYTDPIYGQAGMEASLDEILRGIQGNPLPLIWWNLLVYGQPPPGIDLRTSLDLSLQTSADQLLQGNKGALVLLNASNGEILAMASHPTFNANRIQELGESLLQNPDSPLLNRAAQGLYPAGSALEPLLLAEQIQPANLNPDQWVTLLGKYGMYTSPLLMLPVASSTAPSGQAASTARSDLQASPLQIALAAASLSNNGVRPGPKLVTAIKEPERGWVLQPTLASSQRLFSEAQAKAAASKLAVSGQLFWQSLAVTSLGDEVITWWLGGTLPEWNGAPLTLVVLLEEDNPTLAEEIGQKTLQNGMGK